MHTRNGGVQTRREEEGREGRAGTSLRVFLALCGVANVTCIHSGLVA